MMKRFTLTLGGCVLLASATLVMAEQRCNTHLPASTPTQRFNDHGNGTVTDSRSGLTWKKCLEGQDGRECSGSPRRMSWDKAADTAQAGWRLPTLAELRGLVEHRCTAPAVNLEIFPHMRAVGVWSSDQSDPRAWSLDFSKGKAYENFKGAGMYVRLVRNR
ncbi:MAG: hypothetical protein RL122_88 [Pseudomonadota bacterium]|uniref:DUF1566 domain-containing protein n=1 Tax=Thiothrix fructosivorans TaxID=111770 RepID=A0A8B0SM26_9GAMM|nr:DUF1566 domain-containing protein [Thiothrix fructosivorans]MBO0612125.1 DUF1566 domain-containing protein [Thiothrix fructosivorans]QTX12376.1 DUF1566 domain-containing protein [Thiothrix fructosivorans]